jgi:hypothetical protein
MRGFDPAWRARLANLATKRDRVLRDFDRALSNALSMSFTSGFMTSAVDFLKCLIVLRFSRPALILRAFEPEG